MLSTSRDALNAKQVLVLTEEMKITPAIKPKLMKLDQTTKIKLGVKILLLSKLGNTNTYNYYIPKGGDYTRNHSLASVGLKMFVFGLFKWIYSLTFALIVAVTMSIIIDEFK